MIWLKTTKKLTGFRDILKTGVSVNGLKVHVTGLFPVTVSGVHQFLFGNLIIRNSRGLMFSVLWKKLKKKPVLKLQICISLILMMWFIITRMTRAGRRRCAVYLTFLTVGLNPALCLMHKFTTRLKIRSGLKITSRLILLWKQLTKPAVGFIH